LAQLHDHCDIGDFYLRRGGRSGETGSTIRASIGAKSAKFESPSRHDYSTRQALAGRQANGRRHFWATGEPPSAEAGPAATICICGRTAATNHAFA
jgi:hypothetical protein